MFFVPGQLMQFRHRKIVANLITLPPNATRSTYISIVILCEVSCSLSHHSGATRPLMQAGICTPQDSLSRFAVFPSVYLFRHCTTLVMKQNRGIKYVCSCHRAIRNGWTRTTDLVTPCRTYRLSSPALPLSYIPKGRGQDLHLHTGSSHYIV